jgi:hypothetical protein
MTHEEKVDLLKQLANSNLKITNLIIEMNGDINNGMPDKEKHIEENSKFDQYVEVGIENEGKGQNQSGEELNYFQPSLHLKELLSGDWFLDFCSDKKYNLVWRKYFVDALMNSEYKDAIAIDWAIKGERGRKDLIKGRIIGCLHDAGVLNGSYREIASSIWGKDVCARYAFYLGQGKKQPYHEWICEYVKLA